MYQRSNLLSGADWQRFVLQLLALRHGFNLIPVPDEHKGDFGLEAYSLDGCVYQCYHPQQILRTAELYEEQRDKITADLKKFVDNRKELSKLFGITRIEKWILIVPEHKSARLTQHCQQKAKEIRELKDPLLYVADNFEVMVVTDAHFPVESQTLLSSAGVTIELDDGQTVSPETILDWVQSNNELIKTLDDKLDKIPSLSEATDKREVRDELLEMYILGSNALEDMKRKYPLIYDKFEIVKRLRTRSLKIESKLQDLTIPKTRKDFAAELNDKVPGLGAATAELLAYAVIAEWLMVCPLRPKG
jgi:hypothetical protein